MFRELKNRNGEAKPVEGLYTRENVLSIGQEERERKKRRKFATDFDLIDKTTPDNDDDPHFLPNKKPLAFPYRAGSHASYFRESRYLHG